MVKAKKRRDAMNANGSNSAVWMLLLAGFLLLLTTGRLDLLLLLIPSAVVAAYAIAWLLRDDTAVKHGLE
jgi:hypothetical protein